ncbi:MAG: VIT1/CCC1 transporter family protein [Candidatus Limnocylindrales bacterium]
MPLGPDAKFIVDRLLANPARALDTFVREDIGLSAKTMGLPITAAVGSLLAFTAGALVPLVLYLLLSRASAFILSFAPARLWRCSASGSASAG